MKLKSANRQILRLIRFVDAMKAGRYPNATSFAAELHSRDIGENRDCAVCEKTIKRDIAYLIRMRSSWPTPSGMPAPTVTCGRSSAALPSTASDRRR